MYGRVKSCISQGRGSHKAAFDIMQAQDLISPFEYAITAKLAGASCISLSIAEDSRFQGSCDYRLTCNRLSPKTLPKIAQPRKPERIPSFNLDQPPPVIAQLTRELASNAAKVIGVLWMSPFANIVHVLKEDLDASIDIHGHLRAAF